MAAITAATWVAIAGTVATTAYSVHQSSEAKKDARRQAEQQQQALEALKREGTPAMPDAEAQARARRRSIAGQLGRRGRASTILTSGSDTGDALGG